MINIDIQDFGQGMSRDTFMCFLEMHETEIEDEEKSQGDEYLHF